MHICFCFWSRFSGWSCKSFSDSVLWAHVVEQLQKHTEHRERLKEERRGGSQVHVFWLDVEISVPKSILRYMLNFTQELLAKGNIILFFSWSTRLCSILFQLGNVKSQNSNISANFRGNRVTLSVCLPESLPNSPHRPTSFSTPLSQ